MISYASSTADFFISQSAVPHCRTGGWKREKEKQTKPNKEKKKKEQNQNKKQQNTTTNWTNFAT